MLCYFWPMRTVERTDFALDKYGEVVWNIDDGDEFDETIDEDWERRFPYIVYARTYFFVL